MLILISYATNSGGTYEAGKVIKEIAEKAGHDVMLLSVTETSAEQIAKAGAVILGSNSWDGRSKEGKRLEGQLPPHFHEFRERLGKATFPGKAFAVYGLGDAHYTFVCASADHLRHFVETIKGRLIGEPLKLEGYLFNMEEREAELRSWASGVVAQL